jgi:hypothetical protein
VSAGLRRVGRIGVEERWAGVVTPALFWLGVVEVCAFTVDARRPNTAADTVTK